MPESGRSDDSIVISGGSLSLLSSLEGKLKKDSSSKPRSPCIFKTPSILFRHKENAFLPNYFSIGPMHHGKENLLAGEKIKIMYLNGLLSRLTTRPETQLDQEVKEIMQRKILIKLINAVKLMEERASACYAEHDFAAELGDEFIEVMLLDGCFIVELLRKADSELLRNRGDPIFSMSCMPSFLIHDLIMLENQIPWFVLETLFEETKIPSETEHLKLIELTLDYFSIMFSYKSPPIKIHLFLNQNIRHILDLLRLSVVLPSERNWHRQPIQEPEPDSDRDLIRSITRLQEAGVKFKKATANSILDIRFNDGTLEIPSFLIQEHTETIFRNLIAYEQCLPHCLPIFTGYAKLLDNLIDTPNDIDILCKNKIVDNWMGPEDASQFFNKLYNDTLIQIFYYEELCYNLNQHCKHRWPTWRAYYVQNYFT